MRERDRQADRARAGKGQRERETQNLKRAPGSELFCPYKYAVLFYGLTSARYQESLRPPLHGDVWLEGPAGVPFPSRCVCLLAGWMLVPQPSPRLWPSVSFSVQKEPRTYAPDGQTSILFQLGALGANIRERRRKGPLLRFAAKIETTDYSLTLDSNHTSTDLCALEHSEVRPTPDSTLLFPLLRALMSLDAPTHPSALAATQHRRLGGLNQQTLTVSQFRGLGV